MDTKSFAVKLPLVEALGRRSTLGFTIRKYIIIFNFWAEFIWS